MIMRLTGLSGSMVPRSRPACMYQSAEASRWIMCAGTGTGLISGPEPAATGESELCSVAMPQQEGE